MNHNTNSNTSSRKRNLLTRMKEYRYRIPLLHHRNRERQAYPHPLPCRYQRKKQENRQEKFHVKKHEKTGTSIKYRCIKRGCRHDHICYYPFQSLSPLFTNFGLLYALHDLLQDRGCLHMTHSRLGTGNDTMPCNTRKNIHDILRNHKIPSRQKCH